LIFCSANAMAATAPSQSNVPSSPDRPCISYAQKYCKGVKPGGGRIMACLKGHRAQLAPACRNHVDAASMSHGQTEQVVPHAPSTPPGAKPHG
jgi:hypothetical protein